MEKRFGSSLYGFKLPPSSTEMAAQNIKKKRGGKTPSEKKTFVEQLRKQNQEKFTELYSGLAEADQRMNQNGSIMDLLFDHPKGEVQKPKSAAKSLIDKKLLIPKMTSEDMTDQEEAIQELALL